MRKTVIFDVCGTLFYSNTTFDFIKYYHQHQNNLFRTIYVKCLTGIIGKILHRYFKISIRKLIISTLKKEDVKKVDSIADDFVHGYLQSKIIFPVFDKFIVLKERYDVILVSASIDPVIRKIAQLYNVKFICSSLERYDDYYTGIIAEDLKANKHNHIKSVFAFYSDNLDDLPCSFMVEQYYFIRHKMSDRYKKIKYSKSMEVINV